MGEKEDEKVDLDEIAEGGDAPAAEEQKTGLKRFFSGKLLKILLYVLAALLLLGLAGGIAYIISTKVAQKTVL